MFEYSCDSFTFSQIMENLSIPQKCNLPINGSKKSILGMSTEEETSIRDALMGKNSIFAVKIIAKEFERRFKGKGRTEQSIVRALAPGGKAVSWTRLDQNICELCQSFSRTAILLEKNRFFLGEDWENMPEVQHQQIDFFDKVRLILRSLLPKNGIKLPHEAKEYPTAEDKARAFDTCFLCWRSVSRTRQEKKTPLCYVHRDLMSTSKEYRRRKRMRHRMLEILAELNATIPTPSEVREQNQLHPRDFYLRELAKSDSNFPALVKYLHELDPLGKSSDDIIRALEHPIPYHKLTDLENAAWDFHLADFSAYFELNYNRILLAEAWLRAEEAYKHGGKR